MITGIAIITVAILVGILAWYMPDQPDNRWTNEPSNRSKKKTIKTDLIPNNIKPIYKQDDKIIENYKSSHCFAKCNKNDRFVLVLYDVDGKGNFVEEILGYANDIEEAIHKRNELKRKANIGAVIDIYTEEEYYGVKNAWNEMQQFE